MFKQHKRSTKWHKIRPFPLSSLFKELLSRPDRSIEWLCSEQDQDDGEMVDNGREALHSFRMKESHLRMPVYLLSSGLSSFTEGLKYLCLIWSTCLVARFCLILVPSFELFLLIFTVYLENFYYMASPFINVRLLAYESWQCLNFFCRFSPRSRVSGKTKSSFVRNFLFMSRSVV